MGLDGLEVHKHRQAGEVLGLLLHGVMFLLEGQVEGHLVFPRYLLEGHVGLGLLRGAFHDPEERARVLGGVEKVLGGE